MIMSKMKCSHLLFVTMGNRKGHLTVMILAFLLYGAILCVSEKKIPTSQKIQPALTTPNGRISSKEFVAYIYRSYFVNSAIPDPDANTLRFLQYDTNMFNDIHGISNNLVKVKADLERIRPALIVFIDLPKKDEEHRNKFDRMLEKMGFIYQYYYVSEKSTSINLIASRLEFSQRSFERISSTRSILSVTIEVRNSIYTIFVANASPSTKTRYTRQVKTFIEKTLTANDLPSRYFLFGSYSAAELENCHTASNQLAIRDTFEYLGWPAPPFTHYNGEMRDFVLCDSFICGEVTGSYLYLTAASTHMPLIVDVHSQQVEHVLATFRISKTAIGFLIASSALLLLFSAIGIYYWIRSKLYG